jgi:hypothetical protein
MPNVLLTRFRLASKPVSTNNKPVRQFGNNRSGRFTNNPKSNTLLQRPDRQKHSPSDGLLAFWYHLLTNFRNPLNSISHRALPALVLCQQRNERRKSIAHQMNLIKKP